MNYLYGSIAILVALLGVEQYGEHRTQVRWNLETARLQALADQEKKQTKEINDLLEIKHLKDIEYAKTQAAKSAIADYLRTHGMLHTEGSGNQTQGSGLPDAASCQCGTSQSLEEFAGRCAHDAQIVLDWQEWAIREGWEIE